MLLEKKWLVSFELIHVCHHQLLYHPASNHNHNLYFSSYHHNHNLYHPYHIHDQYIHHIFFMNIFIYMTRRKWETQKYTKTSWVAQGRVSGRIPISASPVNINCYSTNVRGRVAGILILICTSTINTKKIYLTIERGRVAIILWPRSTSTIVTAMMSSTIKRVIVDGTKIPMYTSSITRRHFNNIFIRNFILITMVGGIMCRLTRPISKTFTTTHCETTCFADRVGPALLVWWMALGN